MNRRKIIDSTLLAISIICVLSTLVIYVRSLTPNYGTYHLDVPFGYSQYVGQFANGSTYQINGATWQCIYQSTNASAVINAAVGNATSTAGSDGLGGGAGTVLIQAGTYIMTAGVNVVANNWESVIIEGEGSGTNLESTGGFAMFNFTESAGNERTCTIENLKIMNPNGYPPTAGSIGIYVSQNGGYDLVMSNVFIWAMAQGVSVVGYGDVISMYSLNINYCYEGIHLESRPIGGASEIWMYSPTISNCIDGINFTGANSGSIGSENIAIYGGVIQSCSGHGLWLPSGSGEVEPMLVSGMYFESNDYGVYLDTNYGSISSACIEFQNCYFGGDTVADAYLGNINNAVTFDGCDFHWYSPAPSSGYNIIDAGYPGLKSIIMTNCWFGDGLNTAINSWAKVYAPEGANAQFQTTSCGTNSTAADGGYQTVNLYSTSAYVIVTSGNGTATIIAGAYAFYQTGFRYSLKSTSGTSQTGQRVYWYAVYNNP